MAADCRLHVFKRRIAVVLDKGRAAHYQPRRAKAALDCIMRDERGLNRVKLIATAQTFNSDDLAFTDIDGEHHARRNGYAIDPDGARRTRAAVAADLGSGQIERPAQDLGKRRLRLDV